MLTPDQIRAARGLIQWSQTDLSKRADVSVPAIANIELGKQRASEDTLVKIEKAFNLADIEFIEGGVRKNPNIVSIIEGEDCYLRFLDFAANELAQTKGEILFSASDEHRSPNPVIEKLRFMRRQGITMRNLIAENDTFIMGAPDEYRWMPMQVFAGSNVKVIYSDYVAYLMTWRETTRVVVIKDTWVANEARKIFDFLWGIGAKPTHSTSKVRYDD